MIIEWKPRLSIELEPVSPVDFAQLEQDWGVELPQVYKSVAAAHQGMMPRPSGFNVGDAVNVFGMLLTVKHYADRANSSVRSIHELLKPLVPGGIFPFARTPGGEFLCFDYRNHTEDPQIILVTVECEIYPVADNFVALLNNLHD